MTLQFDVKGLARARAQLQVFMGLLDNIGFTEDDMNTAVRGPRPGSFQSQLLDLAVGESVSRVRAIDPETPVQRLPEELPSLRQQVRNAIAPAVARAKEQTGATYTVEVGDCSMPGGSFFVVGVVTRVS